MSGRLMRTSYRIAAADIAALDRGEIDPEFCALIADGVPLGEEHRIVAVDWLPHRGEVLVTFWIPR